MKARLVLPVALLAAALCAPALATTATAAATPAPTTRDGLPTGPRANGTAVLPSGRFVTPAGRATQVDLQPSHVVLSADGKRLYVSSEGLDDNPSPSAYTDSTFERYVTVLDPSTPGDGPLDRVAHLRDDDLHYGMAETPDGTELWVSEGKSGTVGVFHRDGADYTRVARIDIGKGSYPWGLAMAPDGLHVVVTGFQGNTLTVLDTATKTMVAQVATGEYPTDVVISHDGTRAYVSNTGLFNSGDDPVEGGASGSLTLPPATIGGYNTDASSSVWTYDLTVPTAPVATSKTRVGKDLDGDEVVSGSLPAGLALSPDGATLAISVANNDLVELLDARTGSLLRTVDLHAYSFAPNGSSPNAVAWAPDAATLYVALGGRDAVAAVDPATGRMTGLIPTAWYPASLAVTPDGAHLYVVSDRGLGAGPNDVGPAHGADKIGTDTSYIDNKIFGTVQDVSLQAACSTLPELTQTVVRNNGLDAPKPQDASGGVLPTTYGAPSKDVQHVVFILKENRTYDQVFGDLAGTERDQSINYYGGKVTPNQHAIASEFAIGQNYYSTALTSYDGHYVADTGEINDFVLKVNPSSYANKLSPDNLITNPENLPEGGFIWNNLARAGIRFKVYGEATYLVGLGPTELNAGGSPTNPLPPALYALGGSPYGGFSATYPSQITFERPVTGGGTSDEDRADDFLRDLSQFQATGVMPSFLQLSVPNDHTNGARPGAQTPENFVAENDHAVGRIVEGLSKSRFWENTLVVITEDDTQDGQDHLDASRTFALLAGGHVKRGYVSGEHHSNLSLLKTINLALGAPPTSLGELTATSMADYLTPTVDLTPFATRPREVTPAVNPPYGQASNARFADAQRLQVDVPEGIDRGGAAMGQVLKAQAEGAALAGDPNVPPTTDVQEHTLPTGSPQPVVLAGSTAPQQGLCVAAAAAPGAAVPDLPWPVLLPVAAIGILLARHRLSRARS